MPNISKMNQELVRAFNISLCCHNIAVTNLTVQNLYGKDHIVISFNKNMDSKQCMKYLNNMKEKIIKRSYRDEKAAGVSYDLKFFPFALNTKHLPRDDKGRKKFSVEIDEGVVFNLKCYLAQAFAGNIQKGMGKEFGVEYATKRTKDINFDRDSYLLCMRFDDKRLQTYFINSFVSKIRNYENAPASFDDYLKFDGDYVYIKKSIFDNIEFIKDIEAHNASLICRDFEVSIKEDKRLESLKFPIIDFIRRVGIPADFIFHTSYSGNDENSVLIPIVAKNGQGNRLINDYDAYKINSAFGMEILSDIGGSISERLPRSDSSDGIVYGIDFSDLDISYCVLNKIMESSVINKDQELSIDPELHFRALSPEQSPFNSPTHAGDPGPTSKMSQTQLESPTGSQSEELGRSPRRGLEEVDMLPLGTRGVPGTSREFPPRSHLSSPVTNPHSSKCVGAAQTVPAGTSAWTQPIGFWSSPAPSAEPSLWQPSRPLSRKGANESGSAWTSQPIGFWSSSASSAGFSSWSQSGPSSWKGANPVGANPCLSQGTSENKKSESPKKHWSRAIPNEILSFLKRNNKERNSISSSRSTPAISVTKKPPLSERSASERKAKSNPPSKVTSPTHEGVPGGLKLQQCLTSGQSKELYKVLSPEMKKKLDSGSLPLGYEKLLYLLYVDKRELRLLLSEPKAKEQMCSVLPLPPEKMEQVQSSSPEEVLSLLHTFFSNQKISDNFLISSRVDSPNIKKHLQEEKEVFI